MLKLSAALLLVAYATAAPSAKVIDCSDKENTFYVYGCNTKFTRCHDKVGYVNECPSKLYFDALRGQCDYWDNVKECLKEEQFRDTLLKTPTTFSCKDREDGSYAHPDVPCDKLYYTCVHKGAPIKQNCGYEQFFDEENQRCEFRHRVKACSGKGKKVSGTVSGYGAPVASPSGVYGDAKPPQSLPQDAAPPASPPSDDTPATSGKPYVEMIPIKNTDKTPDCKTLGNGVYRDLSEKCAAHFWKCSNEKIFKYRCPKDLFYDADSNRCDHKMLIPDCGGVRPPTTEAPQHSAPETVDFDCAGKEDAYYVRKPCEPEFFHCSAGAARQLTCNDGLVYDQRISACDYPQACEGDRTTAAPPNIVGNHGGVEQDKPEEPKIEFDCHGKKDGVYAVEECVKDYVQCTAFTDYTMSCPSNLVFNSKTKSCDYAEMCKLAASEPESKPEAPLQPKPETPKSYPSESKPEAPKPYPSESTPEGPPRPKQYPSAPKVETPAAAPAAPIEFSCKDLANGAHAVDLCSSDFVLCWNGVATAQICPSGLMFNTYNGQCDYKTKVPGCNPGMEFAPPATTTSAPAPYKKVEKEDFCEEKDLDDGFYGSGCSPFFYMCNNFVTTKFDCPPNKFYDKDLKKCNPREQVAICNARTQPKESVPAFNPTELDDSFCAQKKDGYYGSGCNQHFYACSDYKIQKMSCPATLYYNAVTERCANKKWIVACGGVEKPSEAVEQAPPAKEIVQPFCERLQDGFYGSGCSDFFYMCTDGITQKMACPNDLFYNADTEKCVRKDRVPACNENIPSGNGYPKTSNGYENKLTPVVPAKSPVDFNCAGKKDGLYALPDCTSTFMQCWNGKTVQNECQDGLFYNEENGMCDYKQNVPVCKASSPQKEEEKPAKKTDLSCVGKGDGYYADGCSIVYYSCLSGIINKHLCPAELRFSSSLSRCDYATVVEECGGKAPAAAAPAPVEGAGAQSPPSNDNLFSCAGKVDGFYEIAPCSSKYASCQQGKTMIGQCSASLVYNAAADICDYPSKVHGCKIDNQVVTGTGNQPAAVAEASCLGMRDGIYATGACSQEYYQCAHQMVFRQSCQAGLVMNSLMKQCDIPSRVTGCQSSAAAAVPRPYPNSAPFSNSAPYSSAVAGPIPAPQQAPEFSCQAQPDGIYGIACRNIYWRCAAQVIYELSCPSAMVFDVASGRCNYRAYAKC